MVMKVDYLGIVNVMADREVVRELLQEDCEPGPIAAELGRMVSAHEARTALQAELAEVVAMLGDGGAHDRAADAILGALKS